MKASIETLPSPRRLRASAGLVFALTLLAAPAPQTARAQLQLANPHWNITLSDFGYSDFMLDNTPGFEGREYLSGEWAAAVAYQVNGSPAIPPQWLEPLFIFPDWNTGSSFHTVTPIAQIGLNADGLPIAQSVVANGAIEVTLRNEMIDTVIGTPMGLTPASATNAGTFMNSDRYVLKQTCTVRNISGAAISNVQLFQFLHGLNSQRGVFDNRAHAGPLSQFRHDITLAGVDPWSIGPGSSSSGLEDLIGFHSSVAPSALEIGRYGIDGNGVDDHMTGKPSDGVHLSIESNWLTAPFSERQGTDNFNPPNRWVSGAQRWELGNLAAGQSVSHELLLTLLTGTKVNTGGNSSGSCNGGSGVPGGVDYEFEDVSSEGSCFGEYSKADDSEISIHIAAGEFEPFTFLTPGGPVQLWKLEFSGTYSGSINLTFAYDPTELPPGFSEDSLCIYQFVDGAWQKLAGTASPALNTIAVSTAELSNFALGTDAGVTFDITAGSAPANSGTISGAGTHADGSIVTLTATANAGYVFSNWSENGSVVSGSPNYTFQAAANRALVANFNPAGSGHIITTGSTPGNGGTTGGGGEYAIGSTATVTATPAAGYKFSKWLENGATVFATASYSFTVESNRTLVAKFKPVYTLTVTADPETGGEVDADKKFDFGDMAIVAAIPAPGYCFVNWTQNGVPVSTSPTYTYTVTANRELVGHFAPGHMITAMADPPNGGSVSGGGIHQDGETAVLIAEATPGCVFLRWLENGNPVSTSPVYTFNCNSSRSLVANFIAQPSVHSALNGTGALTISWPAGAASWVLQEAGEPGGTWTNCTRAVNELNGRKEVTVTPLTGGSFFRLTHPQP